MSLVVQDFRAGVRRGPVPVQRRFGADTAERASRTFRAGSPQHTHVPGLRGPRQPGAQRGHTHAL